MIKDVTGYEGRYAISNTGEVMSTPMDGKPKRILKFDEGKYGHRRVSLSKKCKVKRFLVHRLVALAYIPNPENKPHINHIDLNPKNNHVSNLEWCTPAENMQHAIKNSKAYQSSNKKAGKANRKLSMEQVKEMIALKKREPKLTNIEIGRRFGISREPARKILKGDTYQYE